MAHWAPRKRQLSTPVVKPGAGKTDEPKFPEANAVECHNSRRPRPYGAREPRGLPRTVCAQRCTVARVEADKVENAQQR